MNNKWEAEGSKPEDKGPKQFPAVDNEGRAYDLDRIVVNFPNVGATYGKHFVKEYDPKNLLSFCWEGVRRCVRCLTEEMDFDVVGVLYENWTGLDGDDEVPGNLKIVEGVPKDIEQMCEYVEAAPKQWNRNAGDEMTIRLAYRRNCRYLDNDNYRDWHSNFRDPKIRDWLWHSTERLHMSYYFDGHLGIFELFEGNAERGVSEEREEKRRKKKRKLSKPARGDGAGSPSSSSSLFSSLSSKSLECSSDHSEDNYKHTMPTSHGLGSSGHRPVVRQDRSYFLHPAAAGEPAIAAPTLHPAVASRHRPPQRAGLSGKRPLEELVVVPDTETDKDRLGGTTLCKAARDGHIGHLRILLKQRADPNIADSSGAHPLFYAVDNEDLQAVQLLRKCGASLSRAQGPGGERLFDYVHRKLKEQGSNAVPQKLLAELHMRSPATTGSTAAAAPAASSPTKPVVVVDLDETPAERRQRRILAAAAARATPEAGLRPAPAEVARDAEVQDLDAEEDFDPALFAAQVSRMENATEPAATGRGLVMMAENDPYM